MATTRLSRLSLPLRRGHYTDIALVDWAASGLRVASTVRLSRLDCLEYSLLLAKIGHLSGEDAENLKVAWKLHIKLQF
jgi:mRNA interferase MazF